MENEFFFFLKSLHYGEIMYFKANRSVAQKLASVFEMGRREINTYRLSFHIWTAVL